MSKYDSSDSYYYDVPRTSQKGSFNSGTTSSSESSEYTSSTEVHADAVVKGRRLISHAESPIKMVFDITGSNKEFANILCDKADMFHGQIQYPGKTIEEIIAIDNGEMELDVDPVLESFDISVEYAGDAYCDDAPIQSSKFVHGEYIRSWLKKMWREGGGGGNGYESFELSALFNLMYLDIPNAKTPFYFIMCDEAPRSRINQDEVNQFIDSKYDKDLSSKEVYTKLFEKFKGNVYILQNSFCGRDDDGSEYYPEDTEDMNNKWKKVIPKKYHDHIIKIHEEKSVFDVILGIISRATGARDKDSYTEDMRTKGQTQERIDNVNRSLAFMDSVEASVNQDIPTEKETVENDDYGSEEF